MTGSAVVFDIGGVLEFTPEHGVRAKWRHRLGMSQEAVDAVLADLEAAAVVGAVSEADWYAGVRRGLGLDEAALARWREEYWREYVGVLNRELVDYVRELAGSGRCRTGILSNSRVGAREREEAAYGLCSLVDDVVYSHEVGVGKPDPAVYRLLCERLALPAEQIFFVDDLPANVIAARACGLRAHLFEDTAATIRAVEGFLRRPA
jgi:putative hydrolase of the HAD superfamily